MTRQFLNYSVAMVTPFTLDGDFDESSVPELTKFYIEQAKAPGLLISGTTGEQHCLTIAERKKLYKLVAKSSPEGYPLYAGVAAFKTKDAVELAKAAEGAGCSGIMLGVPPYRVPSQRELIAYVTDVANATKLPIFLYNNPNRNTVQVEPETFVHLVKTVKNHNLFGIKETGVVANVEKIKELLDEELAKQQSFFTGGDGSYVDLYKDHGFTGITSIAGALFPEEMMSINQHLQNGETEKAEQVMKTLSPKIQLMQKAGFLQSLKYLLRQRGAPAGYCPAPLLDPTDEHKELLKALI
ncbi:non-histone protein [Mucor velutinosus]|uniref:Non-histone protein n=1 Tax=Mucor velutinosus TaxID=708070 RepID=A0AAN7DFA7_9FUNG|nr:non-histone protein [Mucor velutinosus]